MRACLALPLGKALRLPDLELEALPDEDRRLADAGVGPEFLRQDDPAVRVDLQDAALAVEGSREALVVFRKGLEGLQALRNLVLQPRSTTIDRRPVECRIAIDSV